LVSEFLDRLSSQFSIDTNRVYLTGWSEGGHAVWDCLGLKPGFFAGAKIHSGNPGNALAAAIAQVSLWASCAANDGGVVDSRTLVRQLRQAGGRSIYTEYNSGGHA